jgi:hypothetical protein
MENKLGFCHQASAEEGRATGLEFAISLQLRAASGILKRSKRYKVGKLMLPYRLVPHILSKIRLEHDRSDTHS